MIDLQFPEIVYPLLEKPKRFKILVGGRGSAKSMTVADTMLVKAETEKAKIGCFREFQNSIDDSVYSLLRVEIERLQLNAFTLGIRQILMDGYEPFAFRGLARNIESIKSMQDFDYFWIEEGQTVSEASFKILTPTLRKEGSEIWITANLGSSEDYFSKRFILPYMTDLQRNGYYEDDLHIIIVMNWRDNPWFPDVLNQERLHAKETLSDAEYSNIWEFAFLDEVENSIVKPEWFEAAVDAIYKLGICEKGRLPDGTNKVSFDPADTGKDAKAYAACKGIHFHDVDEIAAHDGNEACDIALDKAREVNAELFIWDGDGMGALLRRQVDDGLNKCEPRMYKGSNEPDNPGQIYDGKAGDGQKTNKELFYNKRAQYYTELAQRFYKTWLAVEKKQYIDPDELISISSEIPLLQKIKAEVCRIPKKPGNVNGKIQIMPKEEMKRRYNIDSPNMADCMVMALERLEVDVNFERIDFEGWS